MWYLVRAFGDINLNNPILFNIFRDSWIKSKKRRVNRLLRNEIGRRGEKLRFENGF
jgi:hypothetical protein